ncbi:MAG TPA: hypothetical protein VJB87_04995 [Candidatus Nanoarchaeia archaeon]|nr:hypothetical protein [Candidatus Nanoarchaeia archaeon]
MITERQVAGPINRVSQYADISQDDVPLFNHGLSARPRYFLFEGRLGDLERRWYDPTPSWVKCGDWIWGEWYTFSSPEEFWHRQKEDPLSLEQLFAFLGRCTVKVEDLDDWLHGESLPDFKKPFSWKLSLNKNLSWYESAITVLHEMLHNYYGVKGSGPRSRPLEKALDQEAIRLYHQFKEPVNDWLREILGFPREVQLEFALKDDGKQLGLF